MSALRSPHADPAQPTLRQRGADLKAGIARVLRREKPEAGEDDPARSFEPIVTTTPVRTPAEWHARVAPHLLAVHVTDRVLRMDRAEIAAFIQEAGERNEEAPAGMLEGLGLAAREFELLAEMAGSAYARFYIAAGDAIGEPAPPEETEPTLVAVEPQDVFDGIAASSREAAADALADDRVSPELRVAIEAHRDATVAMLLEPDTSNEATEVRCAAVEASGEALRAVPARSIADVRAKLAFLLPEILPDVNGETPTAFIENIFDDVERLAARPDLSALTLNDLAHLHATASTLWTNTSMYLNAPFAWDGKRMNYGPLGRIVEAEADRLEALAKAAASEAARRQPQDDGERDRRLEVAVQHAMLGGDRIEDPEVVAEVTQAWGR